MGAATRHYLPDLVYGANDGIITTFAVVAGVTGGSLTVRAPSPIVQRVLAELAVSAGTVYDIHRFDPARFQKGAATDAPVVTDAATPTR